MDPRSQKSRSGDPGDQRRFPRPRGDGSGFPADTRGLVSPPTRGWTRASNRCGPRPIWFPRPRGDGPCYAVRRMWQEGGFPAHAGMDPSSRRQHSRRVRRFPRPRGDGPIIDLRPELRLDPASGGFPAHAGMDPRSMFAPNGMHRVRGFPAHAGMDRELKLTVALVSATVSPPTRGWTCPYHTRNGDGARWLRFPRPRGDGPAWKSSCPETGGPEFGRSRGFPRPRGDGPMTSSGRQWFEVDAAAVADAGRFPRPRGDGPSVIGLDTWIDAIVGFPRPRGDGPVYSPMS